MFLSGFNYNKKKSFLSKNENVCVFQQAIHPHQESKGPYLNVCKDKQSIFVSMETRSVLMKSKSVHM